MAQIQAQMQAPWQYTASPAMDERQFQQWVALLESRTGIFLPETRRSFLLTNLHTRMRELGIVDYQTYYNMLTDGVRGQVEWENLVDRLTVHETRFYRDIHSLGLINSHYLQPLMANSSDEPVNVHAWSVGCATGEEPYSLAMMIGYLFAQHENLYYGVTATDVSRAALQTGREGIYHSRRVKNVPPELALKFFKRVDEDHVQVSAELRQRVCFAQLNLLQLDALPLGEVDIILCQNVLIYFKHDMRNRILDQLATRLKPNGLLILGAGEAFSWSHSMLEPLRHASTLAYRRIPVKGVD